MTLFRSLFVLQIHCERFKPSQREFWSTSRYSVLIEDTILKSDFWIHKDRCLPWKSFEMFTFIWKSDKRFEYCTDRELEEAKCCESVNNHKRQFFKIWMILKGTRIQVLIMQFNSILPVSQLQFTRPPCFFRFIKQHQLISLFLLWQSTVSLEQLVVSPATCKFLQVWRF